MGAKVSLLALCLLVYATNLGRSTEIVYVVDVKGGNNGMTYFR